MDWSLKAGLSPLFLKALDDRLVRPSLGCLPPLPPRETPKDVKRALFIRPGGLGDALLLLPTLVAFKGLHPRAQVWVLAEPRNAQAFSLLPFPCRVLFYTRFWELGNLLTDCTFDAVIDTEQWYGLSALVARWVKGQLKVGFGTNERLRCFNLAVAYRQDEYEAQAFLRLLEPWRRELVWWEWIPPGLKPSQGIEGEWAAIFPGASHPSRRWGRGRYLEVARYLVGKGWKVVVVGGPGEGEDGEFIVSRLPSGKGRDATGSVSLKETMETLGRCRFLVTTDSGVMHLAALMGVPTFSLFGPGIVEKWAPRGEGHMVVKLDLPCSPCTRFGNVPPCPINFACMEGLEPEVVIGALEGFMGDRLF